MVQLLLELICGTITQHIPTQAEFLSEPAQMIEPYEEM